MAGVQNQMKQLEGQLAFLLEDSNSNRLKLFNFERELKGTKEKLEETEKKLEETEMKLSRTEKKRAKAEREFSEHLSKCQPNLGRSASSTEDVTIREEMKDLRKEVKVVSEEIVTIKQLKSLLEMSLITKANKSRAEPDRIDDIQDVVNMLNDEINELKKTTASMSKQLRQVTASDNQGQPMATTGQAIALQSQTNASQGHANASQVQAMAVVKPHYYSSMCKNIDVDHTLGTLRFRKNRENPFAGGTFKSARPLSQQCSSFSVEITGPGNPSFTCVVIGLAGKKWDVRGLIGGFGLVAYWEDGEVFVSDQLQDDALAADRLGVGDIMKTNVTFSPRLSVQFYKNGREVCNLPLQAADFRQKEFYPVVRLYQRGTSVRLLDADAWRA